MDRSSRPGGSRLWHGHNVRCRCGLQNALRSYLIRISLFFFALPLSYLTSVCWLSVRGSHARSGQQSQLRWRPKPAGSDWRADMAAGSRTSGALAGRGPCQSAEDDASALVNARVRVFVHSRTPIHVCSRCAGMLAI